MKRFALTMMSAGLMLAATGVIPVQAENRVQQRKENQQARIGQGVQGGSLTAGETANLEHKESNLNKEIRTDRAANGGTLTNKEKVQVNRQQNKLSRQIYKDKHNGVHQVR